MEIPNKIHPIEKVFITKDYSFYKNLKFIVKQAELVQKELFRKNNSQNFNGISALESGISNRTVFINSNLIDFESERPYELQRQLKVGQINLKEIKPNQTIIDLHYEYEHFVSVLEKQYIKWWEDGVREKISEKYKGLKNANELCQFARQIRNAFGHADINITTNNCPDPIWNQLNLKEYNGNDIHTILTVADIINFWIEFEKLELKN